MMEILKCSKCGKQFMMHRHIDEFFMHDKETGKMTLIKSKKKKLCDECHDKNWEKIKTGVLHERNKMV